MFAAARRQIKMIVFMAWIRDIDRVEIGQVFYRAAIWLGTSPDVQRLSLLGVLDGWARIAGEAGEAIMAGAPPSHRQREALRLADCLLGSTRRSLSEMTERATTFALADPQRVFYSLSDVLAASLASVCSAR
jgi:hypothetical protein